MGRWEEGQVRKLKHGLNYFENENTFYARSKAPEVRNIGRIKYYPITSGAIKKARQRR